jgi:predicted permease
VLGFLSLCLPIFALVDLGFLAAQRRWVAPTMVDATGPFSFNVALPALLLRLMAARPGRRPCSRWATRWRAWLWGGSCSAWSRAPQ